ncbi:bifunctional adenosylcobinamide kinase/adenosylcobinamide-phosphate guanylyltransferase [Roseospira marina]|uniref:bifunctional adenosylcobinamide kinase/adenosylcobinamide-phosphate guanylyltransferase n=1 Tax=Roseospira marina TaxID=140057 RepID=UPI001817325E|nr:bifunctional adenosylcobinamide kinase/adenosylcobinamide-phosphate guanylyltransferase [Roseospira marina]MBB4313385.1 adenosylcobinamide kinase/adenosylcobinamide-phosphate guanylyltransferase [Roseospira marina]MBB5085874.1 adenosylcobinamide kinase/adenosylcobinamide-phosphate guanylyltransferase [Roseospira marina]
MSDPTCTLILGGARSGKSHHAEALTLEAARARDQVPVYLATFRPWGPPGDDPEMDDRVRRHRERRGDAWTTEEVPVTLDAALRVHAAEPVLVDCLTLWLTNLLLDDADVDTRIGLLVRALADRSAPAVLVANEVGLGLVPETPLGRRFRDEAGLLNQRVAAVCDRVLFVAAGLPLVLKDGGSPPPA